MSIEALVVRWNNLIITDKGDALREEEYDIRDELAAKFNGKDFAEGLYYVQPLVSGEGTTYSVQQYTKDSPDFNEHYTRKIFRTFYKYKPTAIKQAILSTNREIMTLKVAIQDMENSIKYYEGILQER